MHLKIPMSEPALIGNELKYVKHCIKSGWISSKREYITKFEQKFAEFCGTKFAESCCNGTVALHLALLAVDIKPGDEVIVPSFTFIAPANAVKYCGATPVFTDVDPHTWNITPEEIEKAITKKTKAIIAVHTYGNPADMPAIMKIAKKHKLKVIEDCAEAHGAEINGKRVGSFGDIGCFSFFGNKIISCGESGMCITNKKKYARHMNILKNHGMNPKKRYWHNEIGYNYRMTNVQAAIGLAQLENINMFIDKRIKDAKLYNELLKDYDIIKPPQKDGIKNVYWMYSMLTFKKHKIMKELKKQGIDSRPFFYVIPKMPPYKQYIEYKYAEFISKYGMSLPSYYNLKKKDIIKICKIIKKVLK